MSLLRPRFLAGLTAGAMLVLPTLARAQGADVSLLALSAHQQLLGNRLAGGSAMLNFPQGSGQLVFRAGLEQAKGHADRTGVPCAGLPQPGGCATERVRDDTHLTSALGGMSVRVFAAPRVSFAVEGDVAVASVHTETLGLTSGASIAATRTLRGPRVGLNMSWRPIASVPVAVGVGATVGTLAPIVHDRSPDKYTPFEQSFSVRTVRLGLVWQAPIRE